MKYQVGGLVLVKPLPQQFKSWRKVHKRLVRKYEGPFKITKRILKVSYQWELPSWLKIHSVFHASCLKLYHEDMEDPSRGLSNRAPTAVVDSCDKEAEYIIADRTVRTSWRASLHRVFGQVEALESINAKCMAFQSRKIQSSQGERKVSSTSSTLSTSRPLMWEGSRHGNSLASLEIETWWQPSRREGDSLDSRR